ncbi:MAG: energy transducer TonB [Vulcanimicrobiaceae bacterium]
MNLSLRITALGTTAALLAALAPAGAFAASPYANQYVPPKLIVQAKPRKAIAGPGIVVLKVLVHTNGLHQVVKILRSSNPGDNAAAIDIANRSSYRPAHRGNRPVEAFYDFTLKFMGGSAAVASAQSTPEAQIAALIRSGKYAQVKSQADAQLLITPGNAVVLQQLATADYFLNDYAGAAAAFAKVPTIAKMYSAVAARAFSNAAVAVKGTNPTLALSYAARGLAMKKDANAFYALGMAQLANQQVVAAIANLKQARALAFAAPKTNLQSKVNLDAALLQAYIAAHDPVNAQKISTEIRVLDPTSPLPARILGASDIQAGLAAVKAGKRQEAVKNYEQAAALGDPQTTATADTLAVFALAGGKHPDYNKIQSYGEKAVAAAPNDAEANFAAGIALAGVWAGNHDAGTKAKSLRYLKKAQELAKAAGNEALVLQIATFIKSNIK